MSTNELNDPNDLSWTAFRYVSGELAGDELTAFEYRLEDDQAARDAVATAVKTAIAVLAARPTGKPFVKVSPLDSSSRVDVRTIEYQYMLKVLLPVAAAIVAAVMFSIRDVNDARVDVAGKSVEEQSVAESRSNVLALWTEWSSTDDRDDDPAADASRGESDADVASSDVDSDFEVPGWMIAALSPNGAAGLDDSEDLQMEN